MLSYKRKNYVDNFLNLKKLAKQILFLYSRHSRNSPQNNFSCFPDTQSRQKRFYVAFAFSVSSIINNFVFTCNVPLGFIHHLLLFSSIFFRRLNIAKTPLITEEKLQYSSFSLKFAPNTPKIMPICPGHICNKISLRLFFSD